MARCNNFGICASNTLGYWARNFGRRHALARNFGRNFGVRISNLPPAWPKLRGVMPFLEPEPQGQDAAPPSAMLNVTVSPGVH